MITLFHALFEVSNGLNITFVMGSRLILMTGMLTIRQIVHYRQFLIFTVYIRKQNNYFASFLMSVWKGVILETSCLI